jgi:UDP-N-acetylmuramate--alanine ligase
MTKSYFFVGIGGSGMLPLAEIVAAKGHRVAGSDRSLDQGRLGAKFEGLAAKGIGLFAQDGSGIVSADQIVVASAAVEATVPDIIRATELDCARMTRAELLAELFNAAPVSIAVGGTSGKSTVTGMIGWILDKCGRNPTIMNGAVMKNYGSGARVGAGGIFVSEVDESDGSIALYRPTVAVLNNVSLDHKSIEELRLLFGAFLCRANTAVTRIDDGECYYLLTGITYDQDDGCFENSITFGFGGEPDLSFDDATVVEGMSGISAKVIDARVRFNHSLQRWLARDQGIYDLALGMPGRHNLMNALGAIAATNAAGIAVNDAVSALGSFTGLKRRTETVGTVNGVTVIDDFGHNPDKIAATLSALHAFPGRLLIYFQPHGYGPLKQMGRELADSFIANMKSEDILLISDPAYFGGTVDRSVGANALAAMIGAQAHHIPSRADCGTRLIELARPGDRIIVMGARDDTLSIFAQSLLDRLG